MKQGGKGSKKLSRSTVAFSSATDSEALLQAIASDIIGDGTAQAEVETTAQPSSRTDQPLAKSGLRRRSPIGTGRLVERLGSYVVERRVAATDSTDVYRCVHALTGVSVIAKVLRVTDNYNERMRFDTQLAHLETGKLEGIHFISHGKCAVGRYFLVEDGGDEIIDRLTDQR